MPYLPSVPDCWQFPPWDARWTGHPRQHSAHLWKVCLQPVHGRGLKQTSSVTPSVVPTQCIKRGRQPLRQPRWHLSQVQNLFLELFVVKLQSSLEITTQNLPAHKCPPIVRPVCLHTCVCSFLGRNNPEGTDQVHGPLLECQRLSRSMWCGPVP